MWEGCGQLICVSRGEANVLQLFPIILFCIAFRVDLKFLHFSPITLILFSFLKKLNYQQTLKMYFKKYTVLSYLLLNLWMVRATHSKTVLSVLLAETME